jgi:hypothetical protein
MKTRWMFLAELLFAGLVLGGSALGTGCSLLRREGIPVSVQKG